MRGRRRSMLAIAVALAAGWFVLLVTTPAFGQGEANPPHWTSTTTVIDCTSQCHVPHHAAGTGLTQAAGNVNLCQSCHNANDLAVFEADKSLRGDGGTSHAFDTCSVNTELDTQVPGDQEMALRLMGQDGPCPDGYVVCSTCHNQHSTDLQLGTTPRVGNATRTTSFGSTGDVVSGGTYTGTEGSWYLVEITEAGNEAAPGAAKFRYSRDNGTSWFPSSCTFADTTSCYVADGSNAVALGADGVEVTFAVGTYAIDTGIGERWEFYGSWPFMRANLGLGGNNMCVDCHQSWDMDHNAVETWNSGSYKSHPVGVTLNANSKGYDRAAPLDGNGVAQGEAGQDSNSTNDLVLFDSPSNLVQCLTCHGVHFVDSNTETVDGP